MGGGAQRDDDHFLVRVERFVAVSSSSGSTFALERALLLAWGELLSFCWRVVIIDLNAFV